jgi:predicted ester cyclase
MTVEANKTLIRRYVETWNQGDLQGLAEFWSPDMVHHTRSQAHGFAEVKMIVGTFMRAFADLHFQIDDIIAEGDKVVTRMTASATHTGNYMEMAPTGKQIRCAVMGIARVANGKIVEHWGVTDELHMMQQIGLFPEEYLAAMA